MYTYRRIGVGVQGYAQTTTEVTVTLPLGPKMRVPPVGTLLNNFSVLPAGSGATPKTSTSGAITGSGITDKGLYITVSGFTGLTVGQPVTILTTDVFGLDAELV